MGICMCLSHAHSAGDRGHFYTNGSDHMHTHHVRVDHDTLLLLFMHHADMARPKNIDMPSYSMNRPANFIFWMLRPLCSITQIYASHNSLYIASQINNLLVN